MKKFIFWLSLFIILVTLVALKQEYRLKNLEDRFQVVEQRVEFFQRLWDNVPEEYRKEVAP